MSLFSLLGNALAAGGSTVRPRRRDIGSLLLSLGLLSGCGSLQWNDAQRFEGKPLYLTCNVRVEGIELHDGLYYDTDLLPIGTPVTVARQPLTPSGPSTVRQVPDAPGGIPVLVVGDRRYRFRYLYGSPHETATDFIGKLVTEENPEARLATFSADVQRAIRDAKVRRGMTREQVMMALCPPPVHVTPSLQANSWTYWRSSFDRYYVVFDADGRVSQLHGANPPEATD